MLKEVDKFLLHLLSSNGFHATITSRRINAKDCVVEVNVVNLHILSQVKPLENGCHIRQLQMRVLQV